MPARSSRRAGKPNPQGSGKRPHRRTCHRGWSHDEFSRLVLAARALPGSVGEIPANLFWPALLLLVVDTGLMPSPLFRAPLAALELPSQSLTVDLLIYKLHPLTAAALEPLQPYDRAALLPWPWDQFDGRSDPSLTMLYRAYRRLLFAARLPHEDSVLFQRLATTGTGRDVLNHLTLDRSFSPNTARLVFPKNIAERPPRMYPIYQHNRLAKLPPAVGGDDLFDYMTNVYRPLRFNAEGSFEKCRTVLWQFAFMLMRRPSTADLTEANLDAFALTLLQERGNATVNLYIRTLLALWRFAHKRHKAVEPPRYYTFLKVPKRVPTAWSIAELGRILEACARAPGWIGDVPAAEFFTALVLVNYYSGLRSGALLKLETSWLDFETGWLRVPAEVQKQLADQVFKLPEDALRALVATGARERSLLFPNPWQQADPIRRRYHRILKDAELPDTRRDLFHRVRRTSGTYLADALGEREAQAHLGHKAISTTRTYIDPTKLAAKDRISALPKPRLGETG